MKSPANTLTSIVIVLAIGFITNAAMPFMLDGYRQLKQQMIRFPTPTPLFTEQSKVLTNKEIATMGGDFFREYEAANATRSPKNVGVNPLATFGGVISATKSMSTK